jgi:dTMP kinase
MTDLAEKLAGKFIVLDGPDGSGKTTQLGLLRDHLAALGARVETVHDPGATAVGERIRQILLDRDNAHMSPICETLLFMASRAQLVAERVRPALADGKVVLCDRFISATVAYQGAAGVSPSAVREVGKIAVDDVQPDLTVLLDLPAEEGLARLAGSRDRMESKDLAFHRKVRELFLSQAADAPERFAVVDAAGEVGQIAAGIRELLEGWSFT